MGAVDATQMELLKCTFYDLMVSREEMRYLYRFIASEGMQININIDSSVDVAQYDPITKTLSFRDTESITLGNIEHELFHVGQDAYYSGVQHNI